MKRQQQKKLDYWQERVNAAKAAWSEERAKMDRREMQYAGQRKLSKLVEKDRQTETKHVYNITAENIESIVDSSVPKPKVTPRREKDQKLASIIEHMILNELDRLPMEEINDLSERTCPIQGGTLYLTEWDNDQHGGDRNGEISVMTVHPKMLVPQPGVYSGIEDMDYVALLLPDTKENVRRTYGVDVSGESETDPDVKGVTEDSGTDSAEDMVTRTVVYYRNGEDIGKFQYVGDTVLEDLEDYQARYKKRCKRCGQLEESGGMLLEKPTLDGTYPEGAETGRQAEKGTCPFCGSQEWEKSKEDYFEITIPTMIAGETVGGTQTVLDEFGNTVAVTMESARIPYYKPRVYPIVLQKNVSVFGQLLGDSDADKIADQQNTINRMEQKIIDRLLKAGTRVSLPPDTKIGLDPTDSEPWRLEKIEDRQYIGTYEFSGDLSTEMAYVNQVYQESRNIMGITDSYQGRRDTTATSGTAKQFAAQQSAGRMESKRVMKHAAYAKLFERIFKLKLAYADEPQPVFYRDDKGQTQYEEFNKLDFLERDAAGNWRWNTDFIFAVDDSGGLAGNRTTMWRELTTQLQMGAMGDPSNPDTLLDYWAAMEEQHYPFAGQMRKRLTARKQQMVNAQVQAAATQTPVGIPGGAQTQENEPLSRQMI